MRKLFQLGAVLFVASLVWGQQPPPIFTQQLNLPVSTNLPAVASVNASVVGNPGPQTIFYWVVTNYTLGATSVSGPFRVGSVPNVLSGSNYVAVTPNYPPSIASVDLLKTSSSTPPTGACNCAVATGVTSGTINDQSNSTSSYTVSPLNLNAFNVTLDNEVVGAGATHPILRQGSTSVDLFNLTPGGTPGTNTQVIFNNLGALAGSAGLTFNNGTNVLTALGGFSGSQFTLSGSGGFSLVGVGGTLPTVASGSGGFGIATGGIPQLSINGGSWLNVAAITGTPTSLDCVQFLISGGALTLQDTGSACGSATGTITFNGTANQLSTPGPVGIGGTVTYSLLSPLIPPGDVELNTANAVAWLLSGTPNLSLALDASPGTLDVGVGGGTGDTGGSVKLGSVQTTGAAAGAHTFQAGNGSCPAAVANTLIVCNNGGTGNFSVSQNGGAYQSGSTIGGTGTDITVGATCNGIADDTAILAANVAAIAAPGSAFIPRGKTCMTASQITLPQNVGLEVEGILRASAPMTAVVASSASLSVFNHYWGNGMIDANANANIALWLQNYLNADAEVRSLRLNSALVNGLRLGNTAIGTSNGAYVHNLFITNTSGSTPAGSIGIWSDGGQDSVITDNVITNYQKGMLMNQGGNFIKGNHPYANPDSNMTIGFEDTVNGNVYISNESDSPSTYCFHFTSTAQYWIVDDNKCYNNNTGADNTLIGVQIDATSPTATVSNNIFFGASGSNRIATDVAASSSLTNIQMFGNQEANVVTVNGQIFHNTLAVSAASNQFEAIASGAPADTYTQSTVDSGSGGTNVNNEPGITTAGQGASFRYCRSFNDTGGCSLAWFAGNNTTTLALGMSATGKFTTYHEQTLQGNGVVGVLGATTQKAETTTPDSSVLSVTPASSAGTYRACVVISVSAATSGVIGWTATWKDSNSNAQTPAELELFQNGTAAPALTFTTSAAGNYHGCATIDVDNSATAIVIKWIGGGTTTAKMSATIERVI